MTGPNRFKLALERIQPAQWRRFEEFASAFLVAEFPDLRSTGTASGDGGRDGELYRSDGVPFTVLQYSVTGSWTAKIKDTVEKIKKNFPDAKEIIYVTNQEIGAKADELRKELRKEGLILGIRDQSFFVDRYQLDARLHEVAEQLSKDIVDPYLEGRGVIERKPQALTSEESRAALLFLELQWEDDTREKGLTKTAFDALIRTALRDTSHPDNVMTRTAVHTAVEALLPGQDLEYVRRETDKALSRPDKEIIKHNTSNDTFCLAHSERLRLKERLAQNDIEEISLQAELLSIVKNVCSDELLGDAAKVLDVAQNARASLEKFLLQRGETFVHEMKSGQLKMVGTDVIREAVESHLRSDVPALLKNEAMIDAVHETVVSALQGVGPAMSGYLRNIGDAYTLLAFLQQTPDVQTAVKKMFSFGEIWLDTSVLLPLFAEDLVSEEEYQFRRLIKASRDAGLKLKVTPGVIEELEGHFKRCHAFAFGDRANWRGSIPYLYEYYVSTGAAPSAFTSWAATFIGRERPQDDISDFLRDEFSIQTLDISEDANKAKPELRAAVQDRWTAIHEQRRKDAELDPHLTLRLANHDTENFLGVVMRRSGSGEIALGYSSWWLTLDQQAFRVAQDVDATLGGRMQSPVMSADFLANYLAFGPNRDQVAKQVPAGLPLALDPSMISYLTPELVALAEKVREQMAGQPERVIRRGVRDALDKARRRQGSVQAAGLTVKSGRVST